MTWLTLFFRTPLNAILGCADLLALDSTIKSSHKEHIETIISCGTALLDTMNALLSYVKLEASASNEQARKNLVKFEEFNVRRLLQDVMKMFQVKAVEKHIQLKLHNELSEKATQVIFSDPVSLRTVITNLISNACKFTRENGHVDVILSDVLIPEIKHEIASDTSTSTSQSTGDTSSVDNASANLQRYIQVQVKDTGIGINSSFEIHIFKPFSQQDSQIQRVWFFLFLAFPNFFVVFYKKNSPCYLLAIRRYWFGSCH